MGRLQDIYAEIEQKLDLVNSLHEKAGDDLPPDDDYKTIVETNKAIEKLEVEKSDLEARKGELAAIVERNAARRADLDAPARDVPYGGEKGAGRPKGSEGKGRDREREDTRTIGERFIENPAFKTWLDAVSNGGRISDNQHLNSPPLQVKTLITGASATSAGAGVIPDQYRGLIALPFRPLALRDLVTIAQTGSDSVEYVRVTGYTNNAATVAEATATAGSSGQKPESALAMERVTAAVKTIAHWIPATTRALADFGQLRALIDQFLQEGLDQVLEDQMITGDGTGENFTGILNQSGTTSQAFATDMLTTTRKARTKVMTVGRARPTAYVMHPLDWEALDLAQDNEARYYFGGPQVMGTPRLWGLPVVEAEAMPEGTAIVGDLRQMVLWDREQAAVRVSNQHADFFIRNMVAVLAEMRAAFGVFRPAAIVEIDMAA